MIGCTLLTNFSVCAAVSVVYYSCHNATVDVNETFCQIFCQILIDVFYLLCRCLCGLFLCYFGNCCLKFQILIHLFSCVFVISVVLTKVAIAIRGWCVSDTAYHRMVILYAEYIILFFYSRYFVSYWNVL